MNAMDAEGITDVLTHDHHFEQERLQNLDSLGPGDGHNQDSALLTSPFTSPAGAPFS